MKKYLVLLLFLLALPSFATEDLGYGVLFEKEGESLYVKEVLKNSVAEKMGIKNGVKILKFNGKKSKKVKKEQIQDVDNDYNKLKIETDNNKEYILKKENISILNLYNKIIDTYSEEKKYNVTDFSIGRVLFAEHFTSKHIRCFNGFINYADAIATDNNKLFVELFKVKKEDVISSIEKLKEQGSSRYTYIYNNIETYKYCSDAFKEFLELSMYYNANINLIEKQISEFDDKQKKQLAKYVYNLRITANLYYWGLIKFDCSSRKKSIDANLITILKNSISIQNEIYNLKYKELLKQLSNNKIRINKPGFMSNCAQEIVDIIPESKFVVDEQIIHLAKEKGYNPEENEIVKELKTKQQSKQTQQIKKETTQTDISQLTELPFFGNFAYDTDVVDILKYFDTIPTVTSIKMKVIGWDEEVANKIKNKYSSQYNNMDPYTYMMNLNNIIASGVIDGINTTLSATKTIYSSNLKGNISNNLFTNMYLNNLKYLKSNVRSYSSFDNEIQGKAYISDVEINIDYIVIENIPFKVVLLLKPSLEYYYFNRDKNVKKCNSILFPYYYVSEMKIVSLNTDIARSNVSVNGLKVLDIYRNKYSSHLKGYNSNEKLQLDSPNITIQAFLSKDRDNLEINYLNRGCYDSVKKLYELREKSFNLKKYENGNMKNQI